MEENKNLTDKESNFGTVVSYTPEQQKTIDTINQMGHYEMCSLWRFALSGHPYFDKTLPYYKVFEERLFKHFGGFTPEISKALS